MKSYNALHDFTERDKASFEYRRLLANHYRRQMTKAAKQTGRMAIRDVSVLMAGAALIALSIIITLMIWA